MTKWFGHDWGAPICGVCPQVPVPVTENCDYCGRRFASYDNGLQIDGLDGGPELAIAVVRIYNYHRHCFGNMIFPERSAHPIA